MFKVLQICFHLFESLCCCFVMLKFCSKFCTFIFSCLCVIFHLYIVPIRYIPPNSLFDLLLFICQVPLLKNLDLLLLCWFCYNQESIFIDYFTSLIDNIAPFQLFKYHLLHCLDFFSYQQWFNSCNPWKDLWNGILQVQFEGHLIPILWVLMIWHSTIILTIILNSQLQMKIVSSLLIFNLRELSNVMFKKPMWTLFAI